MGMASNKLTMHDVQEFEANTTELDADDKCVYCDMTFQFDSKQI